MDARGYGSGCWRPLCPYGHSGGRAARWAAIWSLLEENVEVIKVIPGECIPEHIVEQTPSSQNLLVKLNLLGSERKIRSAPPLLHSQSLVKLSLLGSQSTVPQLPSEQSQSLLVSVKLGLLILQNTGPR